MPGFTTNCLSIQAYCLKAYFRLAEQNHLFNPFPVKGFFMYLKPIINLKINI